MGREGGEAGIWCFMEVKGTESARSVVTAESEADPDGSYLEWVTVEGTHRVRGSNSQR